MKSLFQQLDDMAVYLVLIVWCVKDYFTCKSVLSINRELLGVRISGGVFGQDNVFVGR